MTSPYQVTGPAILSISGGRTSGYMLWQILQAGGGTLGPDVHAVFADTGKEFPETYTFVAAMASQWGVEIHRVARPGGFDLVIKEHKFLPNPAMRFCTQQLKLEPMRNYMLAQGYTSWANIVGIRADEERRRARFRQREAERPDKHYHVELPLAEGGVTRAEVMAFWASQPFDLGLPPYMSNCDLCFLKGTGLIRRIIRQRPGVEQWWIDHEERLQATFQPHRPSFKQLAEQVRRSPELPFGEPEEAESEAESLIDCVCGD
jgi:hypothetical protein